MSGKSKISISLSDGYTDVPQGKIAAVVTSLEMLAQPRPRPDPPAPVWKLRRVVDPDLNWFRDLHRRVGQDWLWFSRLMLSDDALAAIIHDCSIELYALEHRRRDEGLLELDFRQAGVCELSFFGVTPGLIGKGAGRWLMNRALELAWSRPIRRFPPERQRNSMPLQGPHSMCFQGVPCWVPPASRLS